MSLSPREALRRVPRGLLGMVALVVLCESFIAANHLRFSRLEADDWQAAARTARGNLPLGGILCLGDSQLKFGVSPLILEGKLGQPSQCLAIQGGQAPSTYLLLKRAIDSGVFPGAIVVDFEPHLLRDGIEHNRRMWAEVATLRESLDLAWAARGSEKFGMAEAFGTIATGLALPSYRERQEIRGNILAAFRGETPQMPGWLEMAARNRGMNRGALAISRGDPNAAHDTAKWANPSTKPWAADPVNDAYVRKFLRLASDYKIPVYWALMPVDAGVQAKYEQNGMDRCYFAWIRQLQDKYRNLYVLDWRHSAYPARSFTDAMHLNIDGATSVSVALGDYLQRSFRGEGIDNRWVAMPAYRSDGTQVVLEDSNRSNAFMQSTAKLRR